MKHKLITTLSTLLFTLIGLLLAQLLNVGSHLALTNIVYAGEAGFIAYNDLAAFNDSTPSGNFTFFTTDLGGNTGLPHSGELVDFATGAETGVTLSVTGGDFNGNSHVITQTGTATGEAAAIFAGKTGLDVGANFSATGTVSYGGAGGSDIVLTFTGLNHTRVYTLVTFAHRNVYTDRNSLHTLSGADSFSNESSDGSVYNRETEQNVPLFDGLYDPSTLMPSDNDNGWIVKYTNIDPGSNGLITLTISDAGFDFNGTTDKGRYVNAVMLQEIPATPILTVTKTSDTAGSCELNDCSLREAIIAANAASGPDVIYVPPNTYTLSIDGVGEDAAVTGDLDITDDLTIIGAGVGDTIIDGGGIDRVFDIIGPITVTLDGLRIQNGAADNGDGLKNEGGTVTLANIAVSNNDGGGIRNQGIATLTNSMINDNHDRGIYNTGTLTITNGVISGNGASGGGIANHGKVEIINSTVTNNSGGGINNFDNGTVQITNATISGNTAGVDGGGIENIAGTILLQNTIVAENDSPAGPDCRGQITSLDHNIIGNISGCDITLQGSDKTGNPGLDGFTDDGTPGHGHFPLLTGSRAIDAGDDNACPSTDQLGQSRVDGDGNGSITCDIGAIEFQDFEPPPNLPIEVGNDWRYFKGTEEPLSNWNEIGFDDSGWLIGPTGIGYGDGDDATELTDMQHNYFSVYARRKFTITDPGTVTGLLLSMDYDDGFVAYLNGVEVARANMTGAPPAHDTPADSDHEASGGNPAFAQPVEYYEVAPSLLVSGTNVLAVQAHNESLGSSDLSMIPTLQEGPPGELVKSPYLQNVTQTSIVIMWETDRSITSEVRYRLQGGSTWTEVSDASLVTIHEMSITGLSSDSIYEYQVRENAVGDWRPASPATFRIAPSDNPNRSYRIAVYGDSRTYLTDHQKVITAIIANAPEIVLHVGDFVSGHGEIYNQWGTEFFTPAANLIIDTPLFPILGNHENDPATHYYDFFSLPGNEQWYTFTYGCAYFIGLDTNVSVISGSVQHQWLDNVLQSSEYKAAKWQFAFFHHPPYTSGLHPGTEIDGRDDLVELLERHGVDMVFSGHNHHYERSFKEGVYYIMAGGGGANLYGFNPTPDEYSQVRVEDYHHTTLDISCNDPASVGFTAWYNDGTSFDTVTFSTVGDMGGTLVHTDTQGSPTIVQVTDGAITETTRLVYAPVETVTTTTPAGFVFADHTFTLNAYQDDNLLPNFEFQQPVTVTIHYTDADVAGLDEESLVLDYWNGSEWVDASCGPYDRHPGENWLAVPICHLSQFALFGKGEQPQRQIFLPIVIKNN